MSATEIAVGLLGSVSALYGFALAYYVFARTMHLMEKDRAERVFLEADLKKWQYMVQPEAKGLSESEFEVWALKHLFETSVAVLRRAEDLNRFLLGATATFLVSAAASGWYLGEQFVQTETLTTTVLIGIGPIALAAIVGFIGAFVGYRNLKETRRQQARLLKRIKELEAAPETTLRTG